jgi:phosphoribosylamine--glycine ligase
MKVLVIGSGGREAALIRALSKSPQKPELLCAPGNPGIAAQAKCIPLNINNISDVTTWAMTERPDLTIVGPEGPLVNGIVDAFNAKGLAIFGPTAAAARIEGSKAFCDSLMRRPIDNDFLPESWTCHSAGEALLRLEEIWKGEPVVDNQLVAIKADGLAGGKGVIIPHSLVGARGAIHDLMIKRIYGAAGDTVVIQRCLTGSEVSCFFLTDGTTVRSFGAAQDYKRLRSENKGPNTGGMGAISPIPWWTDNLQGEVLERIAQPIVRNMKAEGRTFSGLLFIGLMKTKDGLKVLEVNCRFGDPETQALLARFEGDLLELLQATAWGQLADVPEPRFNETRRAVCLTMAADGYPENPRTGDVITGIEQAEAMDAVVYQAATTLSRDPDGSSLKTSGGRVLSVVGTGSSFRTARNVAYTGAGLIKFEGAYVRHDIGAEYDSGSHH